MKRQVEVYLNQCERISGLAAKTGGLVLWSGCAIQACHYGGIGQRPKVCIVIAEKCRFLAELLGYFYPPTAYLPLTYPSYGRVRIVMAVMHSIWPARVIPAYAAIGDWSTAKREPDHVISQLPSAKQTANISHKSQEMPLKGLHSFVFAAPSLHVISDYGRFARPAN